MVLLQYVSLRSMIGVYNEDPAEMEVLKNVPIYGEGYKGTGIYKIVERIEFNSTGKVDDSFIGINKSYWISDILEFMIYGVDHFGSIQAKIQRIEQENQIIIIDPETMNPELLEMVIDNLLHPEDDESDEEEDQE